MTPIIYRTPGPWEADLQEQYRQVAAVATRQIAGLPQPYDTETREEWSAATRAIVDSLITGCLVDYTAAVRDTVPWVEWRPFQQMMVIHLPEDWAHRIYLSSIGAVGDGSV